MPTSAATQHVALYSLGECKRMDVVVQRTAPWSSPVFLTSGAVVFTGRGGLDYTVSTTLRTESCVERTGANTMCYRKGPRQVYTQRPSHPTNTLAAGDYKPWLHCGS